MLTLKIFPAGARAFATFLSEQNRWLATHALIAAVLMATAVSGEELVGPVWNLDTLNGEAPLRATSVTVRFHEDGTLGGSSGCNGYSGTYTVDGTNISIALGRSTLMACPGPILSQESAYGDNLAAAATFAVRDDALTLYDANGATLANFTVAAAAPLEEKPRCIDGRACTSDGTPVPEWLCNEELSEMVVSQVLDWHGASPVVYPDLGDALLRRLVSANLVPEDARDDLALGWEMGLDEQHRSTHVLRLYSGEFSGVFGFTRLIGIAGSKVAHTSSVVEHGDETFDCYDFDWAPLRRP